jgi:hypothetical protein
MKIKTRNRSTVKCSPLTPLNYYYLSAHFSSRLMHLPHLDTSLKMSSLYNSGCYVLCRVPVNSSKRSGWMSNSDSLIFKKNPPLFLPLHPSWMCCIYPWDHYHGCPFNNFRIPCIIFWHTALSLRHCLTPVSSNSEFRWGKLVSPIEIESH